MALGPSGVRLIQADDLGRVLLLVARPAVDELLDRVELAVHVDLGQQGIQFGQAAWLSEPD